MVAIWRDLRQIIRRAQEVCRPKSSRSNFLWKLFLSTEFKVLLFLAWKLKDGSSAKLCLLFSFFLSRSQSFILDERQNRTKNKYLPDSFLPQSSAAISVFFSGFPCSQREIDGPQKKFLFCRRSLSPSPLHLLFTLLWSKQKHKPKWKPRDEQLLSL